MTIQNKFLYLRTNQLNIFTMSYDDWKLQTPPEFEDKEQIIKEQIDKLNVITDELYEKSDKYYQILIKAEQKINKIINSDCLIYKLTGGFFAQQKDILKAEAVKNRIAKRIAQLEKEYDFHISNLNDL